MSAGPETETRAKALGPQRSRHHVLFVLLVAAVAAALLLVNAFSVVDERRGMGRPVPLWEPMVWETSSALVLIVLTPAMMAVVRRVRPFEAPWPKVIAVHGLSAVVFSLLHVAAMGLLRWGAYRLVGAHYPLLGPLGDFPYELRKDLFTYVCLAGVYTGWLRLMDRGPGRSPPPKPAAIEVRDGARRHFVPASEVAWIEAAGNYVELHRGPTPVLHRAPLSQMERELREAGFVRIHRSRLVRRDAVVEIESKPTGDYVVRLADGRELAGSRRYRRPLLEP